MRINEFKSNPNQRMIIIKKEKSKEGEFAVINLEANKKAMRELSLSAYKLYMYFSYHKDSFAMWLSSAHFMENAGLSWKTYQNAFNELISKGYLYRVPEESFYFFNEEINEDNIKIDKDIYI